MWLLVLTFALPGLIARDPWRAEDAIGFGIASTMVEGSAQSWATLNVYGVSVAEEGPLGFWVGAAFGKVWLALGGAPNWLDDAIRLSSALWIVLLAWTLWETAYRLAKRPELQPPDPLGITPGRLEYARTVADASVLCLLATLGLLLRSHQTVAELPELLGIALIMLGAVRSLDRPITAGWGLGAGLLVTVLSRGWVHGIWVLLALLASALTLPTLRFGLGHRLARAVVVIGAGWILWSMWVGQTTSGNNWLQAWWQWNVSQFHWPSLSSLAEDSLRGLKTGVWFLWPIWPLSLWAIWHFRDRLTSASMRIPLSAALATLVSVIFLSENDETELFPAIVPLCLLGAIGLTTLRRALISLIDWFALTVFTSAGLLIWLGYTAMSFGVPDQIARNFAKLAPGFTARIIPVEIAVALIATLVWIWIVKWRVQTHPRAVWRALVLSASGTTLVWLLLMTLWLPYINYGKTYQGVALTIQNVIGENKECVATRHLGLAQRASFAYFGQLNFRRDSYLRKNAKLEECGWLLVQGSVEPNPPTYFADNLWELVWQGRRTTDKTERFSLYRRQSAQHVNQNP